MTGFNTAVRLEQSGRQTSALRRRKLDAPPFPIPASPSLRSVIQPRPRQTPAPPGHPKRNVLGHFAQCAAHPIVNMSLERAVAMRRTTSSRPSAGTAPPFDVNALVPPILITKPELSRYSAPNLSPRDVRDHISCSRYAEVQRGPDTQHHQTAARQVASTQSLKAIGGSSDLQDPGRGPKDAQHQTAACRTRSTNEGPTGRAAPNRVPQERNTKPRPTGCATPNLGPQDMADKRVGNKGEGECWASRGYHVRGEKYGAGCSI